MNETKGHLIPPHGVTMDSIPSTSAEAPPLVLSVEMSKWNQTKKRKSIVERQLETNMTEKMISPLVASGPNASKYGRVRKLKCIDTLTDSPQKLAHSPKKTSNSSSPMRSPSVYKMNASNSPIKASTTTLHYLDPVEDILSQNQSLNRFSNEIKSPAKHNKIYIRKDLIQNREENAGNVMKGMFSPNKNISKQYNSSHLNTVLQRTAESFSLDEALTPVNQNKKSSGKLETGSVENNIENKWSTKRKSSEKKSAKKSEKLSPRQLSVMQNPSVIKALFSDEIPERSTSKSVSVPLMKYDPKYEELERSCRFQANDVAWARVGTYPYWPCLVTRDPLTGHIVKKKVIGRGPTFVNVMHVSYLADNGRRGWLNESALRPFSGIEEFESTRDSFTPEQKKKDPRLYAAFSISEKKKNIWDKAVKEAEKLYSQPPITRIDLLYEMVYKSGEKKDYKVAVPKVKNKIKRENKNMSLSESLLGTLFSETSSKVDEKDKTTLKFDVSDVVTACLDDMATKTGNIKIQKQSHMDRWLQKVKSKTPEKPEERVNIMVDKSQSKKRHTIDCSELIKSAQKVKKVRQPSRYILRTDSSSGVDSEESKRNSVDEAHKDCYTGQIIHKVQKIHSKSLHTEDKEKSPDSGILVNDTGVVHCERLVQNTLNILQTNKPDNDFIDNFHLQNLQVQPHKLSSKIDPSTEEKSAENETKFKSSDNLTEPADLNNSRFNLNFREISTDNPSRVIDDKTSDLSLSKKISEKRDCIEVCAVINNTENVTVDSLLEESQKIINVLEQEQCSTDFDKKKQNQLDEKNVTKVLNDDSQNFTLARELPHLNSMHYKSPHFAKIKQGSTKTPNHQKTQRESSVTYANEIQLDAPILRTVDGAIAQTKFEKSSNELGLSSKDYLNSDEKTQGIDINSQEIKKKPDKLLMSNIAPVMEIIECDPDEITENRYLQFKSGCSSAEEDTNIVFDIDTSLTSLDTKECEIHHSCKNIQENITQPDKVKKITCVNASENLETDSHVVSNVFNYEEKNQINIGYSNADDVNRISVINSEKGLNFVAVVLDNSTDSNNSSVNKEGTQALSEDPIDIKFNYSEDGTNTYVSDAKDLKKNVNDLNNSSHLMETLHLKKKKNETNIQNEQIHSGILNINNYEEKKQNTHSHLQKKLSESKNKSAEHVIISDSSENKIVGLNSDIILSNVKETNKKIKVTTCNNVTEGKESGLPAINKFRKKLCQGEDNDLCDTTLIVDAISSHSKIIKHLSLTSEKNSRNNDICGHNHNSPVSSGVLKSYDKIERGASVFSYNTMNGNVDSQIETSVINGSPKLCDSHEGVETNYTKCTKIANEIELVNSINSSLRTVDNSNLTYSTILHNNSNNSSKCIPIYEKTEPLLKTSPSCENKITIINNENKKTLTELQTSPLAMYNIDSLNSEEALRIETERISRFMDFLPDIEPDISTPKSSDDSGPDDFEIKGESSKAKNEKQNLRINLLHWNHEIGESSKIRSESEVINHHKISCNHDSNHSVNLVTEKLSNRMLKHKKQIESNSESTEPQNPSEIKNETKLISGDVPTNKSLKLDDSINITTNMPKISSLENLKLQNTLLPIAVGERYISKPEVLHNNNRGTEEFDRDNNAPKRKTRSSDISNNCSKWMETDNKSNEKVAPSCEKVSKKTKDSDPDISINDMYETSFESESSSTEEDIGKRTINKYNDPNFMKYASEKELIIMDENPHLTQDDIQSYLYDMWSFSERKQIEENNEEAAVKGSELVVIEQRKKKEQRKKSKTKEKYFVDIDITYNKKPIRKHSAKITYCETDSDSESKEKVQNCTINLEGQEKNSDDQEKIIGDDVSRATDVTNVTEEDWFTMELLKPKPNLFKGLVRERLCEICELPGNIVKCRGQCGGMYHVDCVKKQAEPKTEPQKRKKKQGRPRKNANEDNLDYSKDDSDDGDEKQDVSFKSQCITIDNCKDLESQLESKMKEELEKAQGFDINIYSTDDELDWNDISPGKCEVVDIELRLRTKPKIDELNSFKCNDCQKCNLPPCFVCKSIISPKSKSEIRQKCNLMHCNKTYHIECLSHWPQTQFNSDGVCGLGQEGESITCPRHVCHTCVCDDPRGCKTRFSSDKLAKCVRCPAVYHSFTKCLPAGSKIINGSHIVCPRHYGHKAGKVPQHVNTSWCFICATGGTLICCEFCPMSFHATCLNIQPPEDGYMCEDCETGRLPLYGEMVWAKLGNYRWWPGLVLHPHLVPHNVNLLRHATGEFAVRFFGGNDHFWLHRGRVFPYQEGDTGRVSTQKSKINAEFAMAVEQAQKTYKLLKESKDDTSEQLDIASSLLPPHYVKLRVNKPHASLATRRVDSDDESATAHCGCRPGDEEPCSAYTQCLNRVLLTECGPTCPAGERCQNRNFEKRLYPKLAPRRTPQRGWGLHTLQDIRKGQFVIEYVGELIDDVEFRRRMQLKHELRDENYYFLTLDKDRMIDAGPKGNMARFMNHSCEPNCETQKWTVLGDVRVGLFALCDIPAGSEVTFNYNLECAGVDKKRCMCGARRCAGYIGAKPKQDNPPPKKPRKQKRRRAVAEPPPGLAPDSAPAPPSPPPQTRRPRAAHASLKTKHMLNIKQDLLNMKSGAIDSPSESEVKVKHDKSEGSSCRLVSGLSENKLANQSAKFSQADDKRVMLGDHKVMHEKNNYSVESDERDGKIKMMIKKNVKKSNDEVTNEKIGKVFMGLSKCFAEVADNNAVQQVEEKVKDLVGNNECQKSDLVREIKASVENNHALKSFDEENNDDRDSTSDNIPLRELIVSVEQKDLLKEQSILIESKKKRLKEHTKKRHHNPIVSIEQKDLLKEKNMLGHTKSVSTEKQTSTHVNNPEYAEGIKHFIMNGNASLKEKSKKRIKNKEENTEKKKRPQKRKKLTAEETEACKMEIRESKQCKPVPSQSAYEMAFLNFINNGDLQEPPPPVHKRTKTIKSTTQ